MRRIVVFHLTVQVQSDIGRMAGDVRVARGIGIALGLSASFHAVQEVSYVKCGRVAANFVNRSAGKQLR